jgi:membrane-associated phospholipid phosphatase
VSIPSDGSPPVTRSRAGAATDAGGGRDVVAVRAVAGTLACVVVLVLLGVGVETHFAPQLRLDTSASAAWYAGDHRSGARNVLLQAVSAPGLAVFRYVVTIPVLILLIRLRAWWTVAWVSSVAFLISPLTMAAKAFVGRVRPPFANGGALDPSPSFPSGHASGIAASVVAGLVLLWPVLSVAARRVSLVLGAALIVVVGFSRMWLGVHYLSDVLAGWSLGIAWALLTALLFGAFPGGRAALPARQ